jgi:hypothetical protein
MFMLARDLPPRRKVLDCHNSMSAKAHPHSDPDNDEGKPKQSGLDVVWVQCEGYRCMAYLDAKGQWVSFPNRRPLNNVVHVIK